MKNRLIVAVAFLLFSLAVKAQKDTCKVGIYINNIYDFKVDDKSFMADFWIWMNYSNDTLKFENAAEITNGKTAEFSHYTMEKQGGSNWAAQKCRAQLINSGMYPASHLTSRLCR
jgi:hypothetical protein